MRFYAILGTVLACAPFFAAWLLTVYATHALHISIQQRQVKDLENIAALVGFGAASLVYLVRPRRSIDIASTIVLRSVLFSPVIVSFVLQTMGVSQPAPYLVAGCILLVLAAADTGAFLLAPIGPRLPRYWLPFAAAASLPFFTCLMLIGTGLGLLTHASPPHDDTYVVVGLFAGAVLGFALLIPVSRKGGRWRLLEMQADPWRAWLLLEAAYITKDGWLWGAHPAKLPLAYAVRHADGRHTLFVRADMRQRLTPVLAAVSPEQAFSLSDALRELLAQYAPCEHLSRCRVSTFPDDLLAADVPVRYLAPGRPDFARAVLPDRKRAVAHHHRPQGAFAVFVDGQMVSTCQTLSESPVVAEACPHTELGFERKGYARAATVAWARAVRAATRLPLFAHDPDDATLDGLATSLRRVPLFDVIAFD